MYSKSNDTFSSKLFTRVFTFSNRVSITEKTITFNNMKFYSDALIINYTNT